MRLKISLEAKSITWLKSLNQEDIMVMSGKITSVRKLNFISFFTK